MLLFILKFALFIMTSCIFANHVSSAVQRWMDEYLVWEPSDYGGVDMIWIPAMQIWTPDIFINNL